MSAVVSPRSGGVRTKGWDGVPLLLPYQQRWVEDQSSLCVCEKSRRIGIDFAEAWHVTTSRLSGKRPIDYIYSSADESAMREFMEYAQRFCGAFGEAVRLIEDVELFGKDEVQVTRITFPESRGKRPRLIGVTSNPRRMRSKGGDVGLSEFAFHADQDAMYRAAQPVKMWGGRVRIFSSADHEQTMFERLCEMGRRRRDPKTYGAPMERDLPVSLHTVTIQQAVDEGLCELIGEITGEKKSRHEFVRDLRAECATGEDWRREYCCIPSAEESSYLPYSLTRQCVSRVAPTPTTSLSHLLSQIDEASAGSDAIYAGVDVGRKHDYFTLWVLVRSLGILHTAGLLVWRGRSFAQMRNACESVLGARFHGGVRVRRMCIDATGLGMQMAEELERSHPTRVEGVTFTNAVKAQLATLTRRHVEERTVTLPDDPPTLADLASIRKQITAAGNIRYAGERTKAGHADRYSALSLGLHAADDQGSRVIDVPVPGGVMP